MYSSTLSFLTSLGSLGLYSYSMYYLHSPQVLKGFAEVIPKQSQVYGLFKYLTVQCLLIQLVNSLLHVLTHFVRPLRGVRDLVFTTLAVPIGSIVVYTFWLVWFGMGREQIFSARMDSFYPPWLNYTNHIVFAPINILLALQINHKYIKNGFLVTLVYLTGYIIFLHVVKAQTGLSVYPYLDKLNGIQRTIYFAVTAVFAYLLYKSGQLIKYLAYGGKQAAAGKEPATKGQKQR